MTRDEFKTQCENVCDAYLSGSIKRVTVSVKGTDDTGAFESASYGTTHSHNADNIVTGAALAKEADGAITMIEGNNIPKRLSVTVQFYTDEETGLSSNRYELVVTTDGINSGFDAEKAAE